MDIETHSGTADRGALRETGCADKADYAGNRSEDGHWLKAASRIVVRVGKGCDALKMLESDWRMLAALQPHASFIHSFDWQWAWLTHLEPNPAAIHYVSLYDQGLPIAIFPLRRLRRSVGNIKLWMWELPTHPHLVLCDPLLAPQWPAYVLIRRLLKLLNQLPKLPWDALHLPNLLGDSVTMRSRLGAKLRWTHQKKIGQSMYFDCDSLDSALAECSGSFKRNLRRQGKKLALQGAVTLTLARCGSDLDAAFAKFLHLEASGWKGDEGKSSAIALHPRLLGFYTELKTRFAAANACLISLLKLDGVAIAAQFCLFAGDTLYIQKIAYDEAWHAEAPGSLLLYRLIEYACCDTLITRLSLVTGPAWAIGRWNPQAHEVWEVHVFKPNLGGLCGFAMRRFKQHIWMPVQSQYLRRAGAKPISGEAS